MPVPESGLRSSGNWSAMVSFGRLLGKNRRISVKVSGLTLFHLAKSVEDFYNVTGNDFLLILCTRRFFFRYRRVEIHGFFSIKRTLLFLTVIKELYDN